MCPPPAWFECEALNANRQAATKAATRELLSSCRQSSHIPTKPAVTCTTIQTAMVVVVLNGCIRRMIGAATIDCGLSQRGTPPHSYGFHKGSSCQREKLTLPASTSLKKNGPSPPPDAG